MIEVYKPRIPLSGTSFLSKTPFVTEELINKSVGTDYGEG